MKWRVAYFGQHRGAPRPRRALDRVIVDRFPDGADKVKDTYSRYREIGHRKRSVIAARNLLRLCVLSDLPLAIFELALIQPALKQFVPKP